jgi:pectate lyase
MSLFVSPAIPALDSNADPVSGADWRFTLTGTTTPAEVYSDAALTVSLGSEVEADAGGKFPAIHLDPDITYRARLFDADGTLIADYDPIDQPASANALAASDGLSNIGYGTGTAAEVVQRLDRNTGASQPIRGRKRKAYTWADAIAMAKDLSGMYGYAAEAGTIGGGSNPTNIYKVWNRSNNASVPGSLPYAIDQHNNGTGRSLIVTKSGDKLRVTLNSLQNIKRGALTICDSGRVLTLVATRDVEMMRVSDADVILRNFRLVRHSSLSPITEGTAYEKDGLSIRPDLADKVWVDGLTFCDHGDGACDIVSGLLDIGAPDCRVTVSHCRFMRQEKTMLVGSTITSASTPAWSANALDQDPSVFVTLYQNTYEGAGFRCPQVAALAVVHSVENVYASTNYVDDVGTVTPSWMIQAITGGKVLSERDYIISTAPTLTPKGIFAFTDPWDGTLKTGPGALKVSGSVSDSDHPILPGNESHVPAISYTKPIPVNAMPATKAERITRAKGIMANAGAEINPVPDRLYQWVSEADVQAQYPYGGVDGYNIIKDIETDQYHEAVSEEGEGVSYDTTDPNLALERGYTRTVGFTEGKTTKAAIGATELDLSGLSNSAFTVDGNGTGATIGAIVSSDGVAFKNGQVLILRCAASARPIIVQSGTNLDVPGGPITLDATGKQLLLKYDNGTGKFSPVGTWLVPTLASGAYTPTVTAVANCSAVSLEKAHYSRNGSIVTVSFRVPMTVTTGGTLTQVDISLPVASNLAAFGDVAGTCCSNAPAAGYVAANVTGDLARAQFTPGGAGSTTLIGTFQYEVK